MPRHLPLLLCLLLLPACQRAATTAPPVLAPPAEIPADTAAEIPADQWGFSSESPVTMIPPPAALFPLVPGPAAYRDLEKPEAPPRIARIEHVPSDPQFPFRRHTVDRRIEHLSPAPDGSILIGAVEDLQHQAVTFYTPPLPVIPADLRPGEPRTFTAAMRVVNRNDPSQQRDTGSATLTLTAAAEQIVTTPRGRFPALRIDSAYAAKLNLATVTTRTQSFYALPSSSSSAAADTANATASLPSPLLAERSTETVKALFLSFTNQHTLLLTTMPP